MEYPQSGDDNEDDFIRVLNEDNVSYINVVSDNEENFIINLIEDTEEP